ncbi:MAG: formate dehydrogenase accessory sulfurtransferase FdhD [Gammaproteobacteria bacterium]|nr:formate dehydrogenase accessory sulfurtransferase FdhD [Gammaproteobacteria bacterium]
MSDQKQKPNLSQAGLTPTHAVSATDQYGEPRAVRVAGESPLTLKVDDREVVTLMTLGTHPELLALGYLRNQRLLDNLDEIKSITVDWQREVADVCTNSGGGISNWQEKLANRTVTTGCGQGTVFSCTLDKLYAERLAQKPIKQSLIYALLANISKHNEIYKQAGGVHGCALCEGDKILNFVEDVGRHNAADAISGAMWMEGTHGANKIFYTTGRLTSEMVMKVALMGIPVLLSRSGVTQMGLDLARDLGVSMIARAKGKAFLIYNGVENMVFDQPPTKPS